MKKIRLNLLYNNSVAEIILEDGKGNILDNMMMNDLQHILDGFRGQTELKLITFEGEGKHFSFGASVEEHKKEMAASMLKSFHKLFYSLSELSIPTVAKVSGQCLGGGMELALMCNFIFSDMSAKFGQPEIVLGVFPPPASIILSQKIGLAKAEELLITGKTITASEAKTIGLVNDLFPDKATMDAEVNKWIQQYILPKSASSLRYAVKAVRTKLNHELEKFLPILENDYVKKLMTTHDANEGINSFLEKRKPEWQNN